MVAALLTVCLAAICPLSDDRRMPTADSPEPPEFNFWPIYPFSSYLPLMNKIVNKSWWWHTNS